MGILAGSNLSPHQVSNAIANFETALALKHEKAPLELARLFFFGRVPNLEPDYNRCVVFLEQCTDPECHFLLGLLYANGLGGKPRSIAHALSYFGVASKRGNRSASIALGWRFGGGVGVPKSCFKARDYLYPIAEEMAQEIESKRTRTFPKLPRLSYDKSETSTQSSQDVVEFYQYNADSGDASSLLFLGQVFYLGIGGVHRDIPLARKYFEQAASLGNTSAVGYLGQMDFYGEAIEKPNYRKAYHNFRKASKEKSAIGLNGMGLLYWKGIEVMQDLDEAAKYFKQAADLEHPEASYNLGKVYSEIDPHLHENVIFSSFLTALRGGFVLAGFELAKINAQKPATCGLAQYLLQTMLEKHPILEEIDEANELFYSGKIPWALSKYLYLAEQGYEAAQFNVAFAFEELSRPSNDQDLRRRALIWWSRAADQGDGRSKINTGDYFYYGWGLEKPSYLTAAAYYHQAIEKKNPQAAFNLGYMHEHGIGVSLDYSMARRYYHQAISFGQSSGQPEAWLPATLALYKLEITHRIFLVRQQLRDLPSWTVTLATALIFGITTIFIAVFHFGLGSGRRNNRATLIPGSASIVPASAPTPTSLLSTESTPQESPPARQHGSPSVVVNELGQDEASPLLAQ